MAPACADARQEFAGLHNGVAMGLLAAILALAIPRAVETIPPQHLMQSDGGTPCPSYEPGRSGGIPAS